MAVPLMDINGMAVGSSPDRAASGFSRNPFPAWQLRPPGVLGRPRKSRGRSCLHPLGRSAKAVGRIDPTGGPATLWGC
jgi:hypothetical protein